MSYDWMPRTSACMQRQFYYQQRRAAYSHGALYSSAQTIFIHHNMSTRYGTEGFKVRHRPIPAASYFARAYADPRVLGSGLKLC